MGISIKIVHELTPELTSRLDDLMYAHEQHQMQLGSTLRQILQTLQEHVKVQQELNEIYKPTGPNHTSTLDERLFRREVDDWAPINIDMLGDLP